MGRGIIGLALLSGLVACGGSGETGASSPSAAGESTASAPSTTPSSTGSSAEPSSSASLSSSASPSSASSSTAPSSTAPPAGASVPVAKDGRNYKACNDGTCEVLVRGKATLNLNGERSTVTVADGTLKITDDSGYVSLSGSGVSTWGKSGGPLHTAALKYAEGDTAVLVLTTRS